MKEIYFDNASTTKTSDYAVEAAIKVMVSDYANPSSLHKMGLNAKKILENARSSVSELINSDGYKLCFTSGASESNMIAIIGSLKLKPHKMNKIIVSSVEHKSVLNCCKQAEKLGYIVKYIKPNKNHQFSAEELENMVDNETALVSIMYVNNETGDIYDINNLSKVVKMKNAKTLFHCDASQAFGKLPIYMSELDIDMLSFSGHKIHAPKGIGGVFLRKGMKSCLVEGGTQEGGTQESGIRMGTENMVGIAALGAVCEKMNRNTIKENEILVQALKDRMIEKLTKEVCDIEINSSKNSSPYILNFSVLNIPSQVLLNHLQENNIFISTGAACSKNAKSYVLKELGLDSSRINSAIRVSFSKFNDINEVDEFIKFLKFAVKELRELNTNGGVNFCN